MLLPALGRSVWEAGRGRGAKATESLHSLSSAKHPPQVSSAAGGLRAPSKTRVASTQGGGAAFPFPLTSLELERWLHLELRGHLSTPAKPSAMDGSTPRFWTLACGHRGAIGPTRTELTNVSLGQEVLSSRPHAFTGAEGAPAGPKLGSPHWSPPSGPRGCPRGLTQETLPGCSASQGARAQVPLMESPASRSPRLCTANVALCCLPSRGSRCREGHGLQLSGPAASGAWLCPSRSPPRRPPAGNTEQVTSCRTSSPGLAGSVAPAAFRRW